MQLNADIVPIKTLYFVSGSRRLDPGKNYSGLYGKSSIDTRRISSYFDNFRLKLSITRLFYGALSLHAVKI